MWVYNNSYELYHHGILGQKWGVRRYQNEDGSLTPAGEKRYAENYSEEQRRRDQAVYGKGAVRRINKRMLEGAPISAARSMEAERLNRTSRVANNIEGVGCIASIGLGVAGGFLSGEVKKRVMNYLDSPKVYSPVNRFINEHKGVIRDATEFVTNPIVFGLLTGTAANAATSVASDSAMRLAGYNPSKKRYTKSLKSYVKA